MRDASARGLMVGVMYADLDGFKDMNDRLGHAAGDAVLERVARGSRHQFGPAASRRAWAATSSQS